METERTIILHRTDLIKNDSSFDIDELDLRDFRWTSLNLMHQANLIMFIDDDGQTVIFKNRFGETTRRKDKDLNRIDITISARVGCGKTAFAILFEDYLKIIGFSNVNIIDEDVNNPREQEIYLNKLSSLKDKSPKITIRTQQTVKGIYR